MARSLTQSDPIAPGGKRFWGNG